MSTTMQTIKKMLTQREEKELLHHAACMGWSVTVEDLLQQKDIDVNAPRKASYTQGWPPLLESIQTSFKTTGNYEVVILLLKAGADPFQPATGQIAYGQTPFMAALDRDDLAIMRLMLWYKPDYEQLCDSSQDRWTAEFSLEVADKREQEKGKGRDLAKWVQETAKDARRVKALQALIPSRVTLENAEAVIKHYQEIAKIFAKHKEYEEKGIISYFKRSELDAHPDEYRPLLVAYYQERETECYEKIYTCYKTCYMYYQQMSNKTSDMITAYAGVLDNLIQFAKHLKKPQEEINNYLRQAAQVRMQRPHNNKVTSPQTFFPLHDHHHDDDDDDDEKEEYDSDDEKSLLLGNDSMLRHRKSFGNLSN